MIETKSKVTVEDKGLEEITKALFQDQIILIGVVDETKAQTAAEIEYGINDEENRSFMRKGVERNKDTIFKKVGKAVKTAIETKKTVDLTQAAEATQKGIIKEIDKVNEGVKSKIPEHLKDAIQITDIP